MALQTPTPSKKSLEKISAGDEGIASIDIDGTYDKDRYRVKINGSEIHLTGKSFKYLTVLAWFRKMSPSGWVYKDDLEIGFNQARYMYRMKNEIGEAMHDPSLQITENNRLGYYRLLVKPKNITFNLENLSHHDDFEIRSLVTSQP